IRLERTASRVRSSGACHSTISSKVRLGSSIMADSSPSRPSTFTRRSSLPSSGNPRELARRRAGSIVSTATFLPRAAMPSALATDALVLGEGRPHGPVSPKCGHPLRLLAREPLRIERVHDGPVDLHLHLLREPALQVQRLVHRHLLRQRHNHYGGALSVPQGGG